VSEDVKPDPVFDKLGRFTPAATGIDRDDWLFAAGRASARTPRGWKAAVGVLALTQAATLAAWLSAPPRPGPVVESPPAPSSQSPAEPPPAEYESPPPSWIVSARLTGELPPLPPGTDARMTDPKPLTVRSVPSDI
jgi:hypothetical protein